MWDHPGPGIEPVSSALAGGFFTTEPPGKLLLLLFKPFFFKKKKKNKLCYNSHITPINLSVLKWEINAISYIHNAVQSPIHLIPEQFHHPKRKLWIPRHSLSISASTSQWQQLICFLFLWTFKPFHGALWYVEKSIHITCTVSILGNQD